MMRPAAVVRVPLERPLEERLDLRRAARLAEVAEPLAVLDEELRVRRVVACVEEAAILHEEVPHPLGVLEPPYASLEVAAGCHGGLLSLSAARSWRARRGVSSRSRA